MQLRKQQMMTGVSDLIPLKFQELNLEQKELLKNFICDNFSMTWKE
jgi:hypothetical protein